MLLMPNSKRESNANYLHLFIYSSQNYFIPYHYVSEERKLTFTVDQQLQNIKFCTREFTCGISHNPNIQPPP